MIFGTDGQWARTRNEQSARLFLAELEWEAELDRVRRAWFRQTWKHGGERMQSWWRHLTHVGPSSRRHDRE